MSTLPDKRYLITGAAGFVGAALTRRLAFEGTEVIALVRPGADLWRLQEVIPACTIIEVDLLNFNEVEQIINRSNPEVIINCAFPKGYPDNYADQISMLDFSVKATSTLLYASEVNHVEKFIQIGSSTEYGTNLQAHKETNLAKPDTIRGIGKLTATLLCQLAANENRVNTIILRLFSVYGPWEEKRRLIPTTCRSIINDQPLKLTAPGFNHDWIFIDDVVDACLACPESTINSGEIINIASGFQTANERVVELLQDIAQKRIIVETGTFAARSHDKTSWYADITKAREILGWMPATSMFQGLKKEFDFWKEFQYVN